MKKLVTLVMSFVVLVGLASPAFAAVSTGEQGIIGAINQGITVDGKSFAVPTGEVVKAENFLKATDVSDANATTVVAHINSIKATIEGAGLTGITSASQIFPSLTGDARAKVVADLEAIASILGLTITWTGGNPSFATKDGKPVVVVGDKAVKATGANYTLAFTAFAALMVAGLVAFVSGKKHAVA